jgi:hypothetical protein
VGESAATIFDAILNRAPVAAVRLNPDVPRKLDDTINKALEKIATCVTRTQPTCELICNG